MLECDFNSPEGVLPKRVLGLLNDMTPPVLGTADDGVLVYLAGYVGSKAVRKFTGISNNPCKDCAIVTTVVPHDSRYTFLKAKQYTDLNLGEKGLKVPTIEMVNLITALECHFRTRIRAVIHTVDLGKRLFTSCMQIVGECSGVVCDKEMCKTSLVYMVKLFIRLRIHHILRTQNHRLSQPNQKRNRKFLKITHQ